MQDNKADSSSPIDPDFDNGQNVGATAAGSFVDFGQQPQPSVGSYTYGTGGALAPSSGADLVVAQLVEDKPSGPAAFGQFVDLEEKIPLYKRKKFWVFAVLFVITAVSLVAGLAAGLTVETVLNKEVTESPSSIPSLAPSTARDGADIWQALNGVASVDLLLAKEIDKEELLQYDDILIPEIISDLQDTPQFKAANWIVNEDDMQLGLEDEKSLFQRYGLAVLYFATAGYQWTNGTDFLSNSSECSWYGVFCNEFDIVVGIDLWLNELNGTIPDEIRLLNDLEELYLEVNSLRGTIPDMTGMQNLLKFSLGNNLLTGTIPDGLYDLKKIDSIELIGNFLHGTISDKVSEATNLKGLYLFDNLFSGTIPDMTKLVNLEYFEIMNNYFNGTLPKFENPALRTFEVYSNMFTGTLHSDYGKLEDLRSIDADNNFLSGTIPDEIYDLKVLRQLRLANNDISGTLSSLIGKLKSLSYLDVGGNFLNGTIPLEIDNLQVPIEVILRNNDFSGTLPRIGNVQNLSKFWTHYNPRLHGEVPEELCELTYDSNLTELSADCLDIYNDPPIICECCETCCDPYEDKCIRVIT